MIKVQRACHCAARAGRMTSYRQNGAVRTGCRINVSMARQAHGFGAVAFNSGPIADQSCSLI